MEGFSKLLELKLIDMFLMNVFAVCNCSGVNVVGVNHLANSGSSSVSLKSSAYGKKII